MCEAPTLSVAGPGVVLMSFYRKELYEQWDAKIHVA